MEPIHNGILSLQRSKYASDVGETNRRRPFEYMWRLIPEKQSPCSDAAAEYFPWIYVLRQQQQASTGWLALHFGGQIIQIGCRCEFAPNTNCRAWMTSYSYKCIQGEGGERNPGKLILPARVLRN